MPILEGFIIKADSGFYYVFSDGKVYETKLRGKTKQSQGLGYPGDRVKFSLTNPGTGVIEEILKRKNLLQRPLVANGDQLLMVMSLSYPTLDFNVLDRLMVTARHTGLEPVLVLNKKDEERNEISEKVLTVYPIQIIQVSAVSGVGIEELKQCLSGKLSILAGPSGVGKTSILNRLDSKILNPTGSLGEKIKRGKHTTRTSMLYEIGNGLLADTPGFSRVDLPQGLLKEELAAYYPEYGEFNSTCQFTSCLHYKERVCGVKVAVEAELLDKGRYERYLYLLEELKENEERRYK